jgi:hypothetical protein
LGIACAISFACYEGDRYQSFSIPGKVGGFEILPGMSGTADMIFHLDELLARVDTQGAFLIDTEVSAERLALVAGTDCRAIQGNLQSH